MRDYRIGCDAHKRYSQLEVQDDRGHVLRQTRVEHERGSIQRFFSQFPPGTPVALETVGNWYWIADEIACPVSVEWTWNGRRGRTDESRMLSVYPGGVRPGNEDRAR